MSDTDDHIIVSPEFAAIIGLTVDECRALSLRELMNRATDRGYDLHFTTKRALEGTGHLTLTVERFVTEHAQP